MPVLGSGGKHGDFEITHICIESPRRHPARTGKGKGYFDSNQTVSERTRLMLHFLFQQGHGAGLLSPRAASTVYALCSLITSLVRRQPATGIALCSLITSLVP
jgi:hypothetical protein